MAAMSLIRDWAVTCPAGIKASRAASNPIRPSGRFCMGVGIRYDMAINHAKIMPRKKYKKINGSVVGERSDTAQTAGRLTKQ